jgi:uncharacterized protein YoaH (UPF0181 family)
VFTRDRRAAACNRSDLLMAPGISGGMAITKVRDEFHSTAPYNAIRGRANLRHGSLPHSSAQ